VHNGFKVGPNYKRPPAPIAPQWIDADDARVHSQPVDDSYWWAVFNDRVLNSLVESAYQQNLTLKQAGFRVLQTRAQLAIAIGNIFPQTQRAFADYIREGLSTTVAGRRPTFQGPFERVIDRQFVPERWFNIYDLGFNLAWEVDIWGKLRRMVEAANAQLNVSVEDYDAVLVTLVADVAQAYTQIRTLQAEIEYTKANIDLPRRTLTLVTERYKGGAVSKLDVTQATQNLADTEALLRPLEISLRQANNRLCLLLGIPMDDLTKQLGAAPIPVPPTDVTVGIPADLIRRRPDVRAAERRLAAQRAQIGISEAELYPTLAINGVIGYMSGNLKDLFNDQSIFGRWDPSLQWNILNYGRLLNNIRGQEAHFQELAMAYFNQVIQANKEVENALVQFLQSQQLVKDLERAVAGARESVDLALVQYREGKTDFIRVFVIERDLVGQQDQLARARGEVAQGLIAIYRALGGGWQIRCASATTGTAEQPTATPAEAAPTPPALPDAPELEGGEAEGGSLP
jgi:NodT family efflux transporter outer membrane factor (OMF) lipoprotein